MCTEEGEWWRHHESNRTWTNFTICKATHNSHHSVRPNSRGQQRVRGRVWGGGWLGEGLIDCVSPCRQP